MANRFVLKQFAGSATNNGAFGAAQATGAGVQPVANIEDVQSLAAFEQGWNSATLTADKLPPLEEMQGLEAILCKAIKENYSEGIPFWIAGETYYQNSRAVYNGKIYRNTTGSYTANNPATDTTNWELDKPDFAGIADKLGSSTVGSPSQGIYLVDGVPTPLTTGFADVDLSNLSATGQAVIDGKADIDASNFNSAGKSLLSGLSCMSDGTLISQSFASNTEFTAPDNGWFKFRGVSTASPSRCVMANVSVSGFPSVGGDVPMNGALANIMLRVKKGDSVSFQFSNLNIAFDSGSGAWFFPDIGEV